MLETATVIRPADDELDLFGITHRGKVRTENQDHFLVSTVHPQVVIHGTSLPSPEKLPLRGTRFATVLVLADGVGGAAAGSEAARLATEAVTRYVTTVMRSFHAAGQATEEELVRSLKETALEAHKAVKEEAANHPDQKGMATTLTACVVVYPWAYVIQVGDSRCYFYGGGKLSLLTRDQTVAQSLIDQGLMPAERLEASPFKHVLSSAIGSDEAVPVVTPFDISERGALILMCSDGLTKHVNDGEIESYCRNMQSSEQVARDLLDLALDRGGRDNVTIIAARAPLKKQ
ncbi:MAG TPA: protein phosphatase 2C domain-containing protein [Gemmatimonadaceae bacterium]|jgi:protein phosphatase|nr:protein phosphatase 2C domain-containing protein [Gemmatimonadaceae bacterium]